MIFKEFCIGWLVLLFMRISIYCNADEITYNSTGPNLPAIPDNVKAVQVGNSDVLVTWEMPESHRNQNLTHRVFYAPVEYRDKWKIFDVTGSTATIIGSLNQDETYTIRVSAVSLFGQGPMSHPVTVTIQHLGEYLLPLDVRQIGAKNVLIQWDKLNLTDIELESVKRLVLNHMTYASTTVETHDVPDWKTRTHYLLQEVDVNSKHTFQLVVFFELQSKAPVVSKPAEFELVPRAPDESMLRLTSDMDIYEYPDYSYRYDARECTRMPNGENFISTRQYEKIVTEKIKCYVRDDGKYNGVMNATVIWFYKQNNLYRKLAVIDNKTLTWIMAHF